MLPSACGAGQVAHPPHLVQSAESKKMKTQFFEPDPASPFFRHYLSPSAFTFINSARLVCTCLCMPIPLHQFYTPIQPTLFMIQPLF